MRTLMRFAFLLTAVALACVGSGAMAQAPKSGEQSTPPVGPPQSRPDQPKDQVPKDALPKDGQKGATPAPKGGPGQAKGAEKKGPPPIAVLQPRTPAEREKALSDLYAHLATSESEAAAKTVAQSIEKLWLNSGSDTVALLMERAIGASQSKKPQLALKMFDAVVEMAPDYAEGWNRRAYLHFSEDRMEQAIGDLRRVLALDPNHFKALDGLAHILKDIGQKKGALAAVRRLLEVHPFAEGAKQMHDELAREVEGQAL
jgi:tetratricopeptide (TPR) repeat protein